MQTLNLKVTLVTLLFLCSIWNYSTAQDLQPKSGSDFISAIDTLQKNIPLEFSLEKQATIYAKRHAKRLSLDNIQTLKLNVRRLEYLKKCRTIYSQNPDATVEELEEIKDEIERDYYSKFFSILTYEQKKLVLKAQPITHS